jgi:glycosyltransferase involved in cell wall biosynthesis
MLTAASTWLGQCPDCDLILAGDGPQREVLEKTADDRGLADRVHFLGFRTDVPRILARSEMLVLPSRWEGMPNVVLEAMAAGLPVVATAVEGVLELLGDEAEQQAVAPDDLEAFAANITRLLSDRDLAGRLGQENCSRVTTHFQINQMVDRYETLWDELLA